MRILHPCSPAAALVALALAGCKPGDVMGSHAGSEPSGPDARSATAEVASAAPPSAPPLDTRPLADAYTGVIGEKSRIVVRLHPAADAGADILQGEYFYEAVGDGLALSGALAPTGHLTLTETARDGKVTGTFAGDRFASGAFGGSWTGSASAHAIPFTLSPIPRAETTGPVRLYTRGFHNQARATEVPKPMDGDKPPTSCDVKVQYPEVFGLPSANVEASINKKLSGEDERACDMPCEGKQSFQVAFNRAGVLSVDVNGYHSCWGTAHPSNAEGASYNFVVATGELLTLERVFKKPFAASTAKLFKPIIEALLKGQSPNGAPLPADDGVRDAVTTAFETPDFLFVEGGVTFSIARGLPHALQGIEEKPAKLTFAQLAGALDPSSPVAFLWKH